MNREYPTRQGVPINPHEVGILPYTPDRSTEAMTIHHGAWPLSLYEGGLLLMQTFRDIESNQHNLWQTQHNLGKTALHSIYLPPKPPTIEQAMDYVVEAYETGIPLQTGSYGRREHKKITKGRMDAITREYNLR